MEPDRPTPPVPGRTVRALTWTGGILLLVLGFLGLAPVYAANTVVEAFGFPATLAIIAAGGLCASLGGGLVYRARQWRALQPDRAPAPDSRAPVLYLRAFAVDGELASAPALSRMQPWITESAEENLVAVLDEIGPVTALGKPAGEGGRGVAAGATAARS